MKRKKQKRKHRFALAAFFSLVIFVFMLAVSLTVGGLTMLRLDIGLFLPVESLSSPRGAIISMVVWSTALGLLLSLVLGRISISPVNRVIDAMNALAHGDFSTRLHFRTALGRLPAVVETTESFNHMAEELGKTEMLRSDFVNNFSHEFKTPIVSIAGFADLMMEGGLSEEEQEEYIRIISEESHRLADMATNVLNLAKIENQTILTDAESFNLSEQIRTCLLVLESKWTEKELELDIDFGEYQVWGNRELLHQVWLNLLDNAVKFSDAGGTVKVAITETREQTLVSVSNTGPEIPMDSMDRIFSKFYQADKSHASQGNGIGLSVVKAIVELHGGEVLVSCGGGWTVFTVALPR